MFTLLNPHSELPVILLCEHAENKVPVELNMLGLPDASILNGHHGFDPPMKQVTTLLAEKFGATTIMGNYSRLVVDLNRRLSDDDLIPALYFGQEIPANKDLSPQAYQDRIAMYYAPYHAMINFQIERLKKLGHTPFIFSLHSFTENPGFDYPPRPWDIGLLYNKHETSAHFFDAYLSEHHPEMFVGHNEPYCLKTHQTSSVITHGEDKDLPYLLIELKNEKFDRGEHTHDQWAEIFTRILQQMISN